MYTDWRRSNARLDRSWNQATAWPRAAVAKPIEPPTMTPVSSGDSSGSLPRRTRREQWWLDDGAAVAPSDMIARVAAVGDSVGLGGESRHSNGRHDKLPRLLANDGLQFRNMLWCKLPRRFSGQRLGRAYKAHVPRNGTPQPEIASAIGGALVRTIATHADGLVARDDWMIRVVRVSQCSSDRQATLSERRCNSARMAVIE